MVFIKKILRKYAFTARLLETYFFSKKYLIPKGWFLSRFLLSPVDEKNVPLPWFTYASIHFITQKLNTSFTVFEFGSGNSTLWFASKVKSVFSVEHDADFYAHKRNELKSFENIQCELIPLGEGYSDKILDFDNAFDIIVIDGRERVNCAKNSIKALKKDGIIIWDNSDRDEYAEGYDHFVKNGFKKIDFKGLGPINHSEWQTSIFYRTANCFDI
ncbi:FkbM family methyltransferase [Kordia sp. YSTF-M3]|uniref:FkbM family methyltransferase n=1 Tax=Kordia aestuariivivens TaxID=2759037 RepID=A0ABR7QCV1_9FLAO|nr:FkbM family methyltransferase [Kordia aestuariivivens]MBC8756380.1 FkbM family methyltransferase [Kordia aestuariivivens]